MNNTKRLLAALLVLFILAQYLPGIIVVSAADTLQYNYSGTSNSGKRDEVGTTLNGTGAADYYGTDYDYATLSQQSSSALLSSLRTLMTSTHTKTSSYDNCKNMADQTDCELNNGKVTLLYTDVSTTSSDWNREHVWPKSLGGFSTSGPGADLHHIRPTDNQVNTNRDNNKYGNVSNGTSSYGKNAANGVLGGYYNSTYFEPLDNVKGDVARICLYMYVRYGGSYSKCSSITNVFQSVDVLLQWCQEDPVDTWELGRNEVVEGYQGNRNVFIDYPEYAWLLFGKSVPSNMTTPSQGGTGTTTPNNPGTSGDNTTPSNPSTPGDSFTGSGSIDFSQGSQRESWDGTQQTWKNDSITLLNEKSSSASAVADYTGPARFYAGSKITITASGMTEITFVCNSTSYASTLKSSINATNCTVSVSDKTVTVTFATPVNSFVIEKLSAQVRLNSMKVVGKTTTPDDDVTDNPSTETNPPETTPSETVPSETLPPVDSNKDGFLELAAGIIDGSYRGETLYNAICQAVEIYNGLSDADKASVAETYNNLKTAIDAYNADAAKVNADADAARDLLLPGAIVTVSLLAFAGYSLLGKKILLMR